MNVLVVDDHPMTVAGYIESLSKTGLFPKQFIFTKAYNCEEAFNSIENTDSKNPFALAIIDQGLPAYKAAGILSGSDLAEAIRKKVPSCKIIMITAHTEVITIYNIFKKIQPNGLIIKNDISPENFPAAVSEIISGSTFQSPTAKAVIQEIWKKELMVDDINRQILMYLSKGYKIKNLEETLSLSISPIQRRIAQMKSAFNVTEETSLIREAILQGFLTALPLLSLT